MENFELIHRFLDGELDASQEEQFFGELSSSEELRVELKEQMAMKQAITRDYKAFTPAASSTVAIFSRLGFAGGAAAAATAVAETAATETAAGVAAETAASTAVKTGLWQGLRAFFSRYSGNFAVGLTSAAAAAVAVFLLLSPASNAPENNKTVSGIPNMTSSEAPVQTIPFNDAKSGEPKVIYKYIVVNRQANPEAVQSEIANNNDVAVTTPETNSELSIARPEPASVEPSNIEQSRVPGIGLLASAPNASMRDYNLIRAARNLNGGKKLGLSVELRGSSYKSDVAENLDPKRKQFANNSAIALFYDVSEDVALGVDFRFETFFQKYDGIEYLNVNADKKGAEPRYEAVPTIYSQEANLQTASLALRYKPSYLEIYSVRPVAGLSLGANKAGAVGRLMFGATYAPFDFLDILVAYDYSLMRFNHQNSWFNAGKTGSHVGFAYKF